MLWTIAIVALVLWMIGQFTSYTLGGAIHLLVVVALIAVVIQMFQQRRLSA